MLVKSNIWISRWSNAIYCIIIRHTKYNVFSGKTIGAGILKMRVGVIYVKIYYSKLGYIAMAVKTI